MLYHYIYYYCCISQMILIQMLASFNKRNAGQTLLGMALQFWHLCSGCCLLWDSPVATPGAIAPSPLTVAHGGMIVAHLVRGGRCGAQETLGWAAPADSVHLCWNRIVDNLWDTFCERGLINMQMDQNDATEDTFCSLKECQVSQSWIEGRIKIESQQQKLLASTFYPQ